MATESLIVKLDARTEKLEAKLKRTDAKLNQLSTTTTKVSKSFGQLSNTAKNVALSVVGATAAFVAYAKIQAQTIRETESLAKAAGESVASFKSMAFALGTVGFNAEKLGDITKDTREKIGDFLNTGGGSFQDFADAMRLTKAEARAAADEFKRMSGVEILQEMTTRMEKAGVSSVQMSHALEGMASDTTRLIPLLTDGGKAVNNLRNQFDKLNVELSEEEKEQFKQLSNDVDLAQTAFVNWINNGIAPFLPLIGEAAIALAEFFAISQSQSDLKDIMNNNELIKNVTTLESIAQLEKALIQTRAEASTGGGEYGDEIAEGYKEGEEHYIRLLDIENLIHEQKKKIEDANAAKTKTPDIQTGDLALNSTGTGTVDELQEIENRFKDEEQLLADKLARELKMVGENKSLRYDLETQYWADVAELEILSEEERAAREAESLEKTAELKKSTVEHEDAMNKSVANNAIGLARAVFGNSKAVAVASIASQKASALSANAVATAAGATAAFGAQQVVGDPSSLARGTAAAAAVKTMGAVNAGLIIATGLGQAAGAMSGSSGGSSVSGGDSSGSSNSTQQGISQDGTSSLELTDSSESGSQSNTINFGTDSGDDLIDAIAAALNKAQIEGRA